MSDTELTTEIPSWHDVYGEPESFGLEKVAEIGEYGYDWSLLVVWRRLADGAMFWDSNSGCSCVGPWEFVRSTSELRSLTRGTWDEFRRGVMEFSDTPWNGTTTEAAVKLLAKVTHMVPR